MCTKQWVRCGIPLQSGGFLVPLLLLLLLLPLHLLRFPRGSASIYNDELLVSKDLGLPPGPFLGLVGWRGGRGGGGAGGGGFLGAGGLCLGGAAGARGVQPTTGQQDVLIGTTLLSHLTQARPTWRIHRPSFRDHSHSHNPDIMEHPRCGLRRSSWYRRRG